MDWGDRWKERKGKGWDWGKWEGKVRVKERVWGKRDEKRYFCVMRREEGFEVEGILRMNVC